MAAIIVDDIGNQTMNTVLCMRVIFLFFTTIECVFMAVCTCSAKCCGTEHMRTQQKLLLICIKMRHCEMSWVELSVIDSHCDANHITLSLCVHSTSILFKNRYPFSFPEIAIFCSMNEYRYFENTAKLLNIQYFRVTCYWHVGFPEPE